MSGDNFISPAVKSATNVSSVLGSLVLGTDYSDIKRFNATTQTWESYNAGAFTQFEPGKGYIIVGGSSNGSFSYGKTETTTTFVYDSTGARVKKVAGSTTSIYLGKDYDVTGSTSTKYVFLGDRRISNKTSAGTVLYYHEDHISSSNIITDSSGNQAAMYEYDPYGSTVSQTGSATVKHQFTGQEKDDSTKLHYYNARYYDSQLGRFITADPTIQHPTDPQDFNRYAYARNNPIRFTDPTGLGWLSKLFAAVFAAVAVVVTWGAATPFIIAAATIAGALGGVAGAAIEKSSLVRGAIEGAAIGAAIGSGAVAAQGGAAGAGGGSGGGTQVNILTSSGIENSTIIEITGVKAAIAETGASSKVTAALFNLVGSGVAYASETKSNNYEFHLRAVRAGSQGSASKSLTGHAWIALTDKTGKTIDYGFRNASPVNSPYDVVQGKIDSLDSKRYPSFIERKWNVSKMKFQAVLDLGKRMSNATYCGAAYNCTDFAVDAATIAGINIPRNEYRRAGIADPNKLSDWMERENAKDKK